MLFANHDFDDFFVGVFHTLFAQAADVIDGIFGSFPHQSIAGLEILIADVHIVAQDSGFNCGCDLSRTGRFCAVTDDATCSSDRIGDRVRNAISIRALKISDARARTCARAYRAAKCRETANAGLLVDGDQVRNG